MLGPMSTTKTWACQDLRSLLEGNTQCSAPLSHSLLYYALAQSLASAAATLRIPAVHTPGPSQASLPTALSSLSPRDSLFLQTAAPTLLSFVVRMYGYPQGIRTRPPVFTLT